MLKSFSLHGGKRVFIILNSAEVQACPGTMTATGQKNKYTCVPGRKATGQRPHRHGQTQQRGLSKDEVIITEYLCWKIPIKSLEDERETVQALI